MNATQTKMKDGDVELRRVAPKHAEALFALVEQDRARLREWLPWIDNTKTANDTKTFIKIIKKKGEVVHVIFKNKELVGIIGLHKINKNNRKATIGYWLAKNAEGQGIMTRAVRLILQYAFNELHLHRVVIDCATENNKSCAIPERLGFTKEGQMRDAEWLYDHFVDLKRYSILEHEFKN